MAKTPIKFIRVFILLVIGLVVALWMHLNWDYNVGLTKLKEDLERTYRAKGYITGLDGRKLFIRQEYKLLNSLFQSAAALVFKKWMVLANIALRESGKDIKQIIA